MCDGKSEEWFYRSFKKKYKDRLCLRASATKEEKVKVATKENLKKFYDNLVAIIEEYNIEPSQIHNVGESKIDLSLTGKNILDIRETSSFGSSLCWWFSSFYIGNMYLRKW